MLLVKYFSFNSEQVGFKRFLSRILVHLSDLQSTHVEFGRPGGSGDVGGWLSFKSDWSNTAIV